MLHKSFEPLDTKVDAQAGTFEATVAIFDNVDKGGDRIKPGAFEKSLAAWKASGDPIPVIFNHDWGTPDAHIGVVEEAMETTKGLFIKGRLDISDNPVAKQVHRLMQRRSLKEFSFGYSVPKGGEKRAKDGANDLYQIDLAEVGPTLKGMNPATELHAVKSALGVDEKPDPAVLRKQSEQLERDVRDQQLPDVPPPAAPESKEPDLAAQVEALKAQVASLTEQLSKPDPAELRKQSERLEREIVEQRLPDVPEQPKAPEAPEPDVHKELQEVKSQLAETRALLEDLKSKAEATDKDPDGGRSVDPLRRRSEDLALEIASGGMSLRKPPTKAAEPQPEPVDPDELKARSRDLMFEVLSYHTE